MTDVPQAPGISVRSRDSAPPAITPTAVAGFVGIAERGPIGVPQRLRSWGEYLEVFGNYVPYGHLAETVFAFFLNGGERCWVVRAADTRNRSAENPPGQCLRVDLLARAKALLPILDRQNHEALKIEAIDEGIWGNRIVFAIDQNSTRDMALTTLRAPVVSTDTALKVESVLDIDPGSGIQLSAPGNPPVVCQRTVTTVDLAQRELTIGAAVGADFPAGSTVSGRGFRIQFRRDNELEVFDQLSMTRDHPRYFMDVIQGDPNVRSYVERREQGHSILVYVAHLQDSGGAWCLKPRSTPGQRLSGGGDGFGYASIEVPATVSPGSMFLFARNDRGTAAEDLQVTIESFETITALPVIVVPGNPREKIFVEDAEGFIVGDNLTLRFTLNGVVTAETRVIAAVDTLTHRLEVGAPFGTDFPIGASAFTPQRFNVVVHCGDQLEPVETLRNLSGDPAAGPRWFGSAINDPAAGSKYLCADPAAVALIGLSGSGHLAGGSDPGMIDYRLYTGYDSGGGIFTVPGSSTAVGLASLEMIEEVCVVAIPDLHRLKVEGATNAADYAAKFTANFAQGQRDLLRHCWLTGGRFALLDPPPDAEPERMEGWPLQFADTMLAKNGALYFPWVTGTFESFLRRVPPCGFVAGQIAATDRQFGVGKSPANSTLKGIVALQFSLDRESQHPLHAVGVNCIRKFEEGEVRLFGARTLTADLRFQHVNVRRVLLAVVKTLTRNLLWAVFEPNDAGLQRRIESAVTGYLNALVAKGMTASPDRAESFYVKCNAETNPREVQDAGQVIAEIGLALAAPAEFIVLTARKSPESLSIVEEDA